MEAEEKRNRWGFFERENTTAPARRGPWNDQEIQYSKLTAPVSGRKHSSATNETFTMSGVKPLQ